MPQNSALFVLNFSEKPSPFFSPFSFSSCSTSLVSFLRSIYYLFAPIIVFLFITFHFDKIQVNGYVCACPAGYFGLKCERQVDHCASTPCRNNGTCVNAGSRYNCICPSGILTCFHVNIHWNFKFLDSISVMALSSLLSLVFYIISLA